MEAYLKGKAQYGWPPFITSLDQALFILNMLFTYVTKQATLMWRSTVLSFPLSIFWLKNETTNTEPYPSGRIPWTEIDLLFDQNCTKSLAG